MVAGCSRLVHCLFVRTRVRAPSPLLVRMMRNPHGVLVRGACGSATAEWLLASMPRRVALYRSGNERGRQLRRPTRLLLRREHNTLCHRKRPMAGGGDWNTNTEFNGIGGLRTYIPKRLLTVRRLNFTRAEN
jgi:hypothetical protein